MTPPPTVSRFQRFLNGVEVLGNALPHPASLFLLLCGLVVVLSWLCHTFGVQVMHPSKGTPVEVVSLLSADGLGRIILGLLPNFIGFAPLGSVLVCVMGLSVAEHSGLLAAVMRRIVQATPPRLLTGVVVFCGTLSHSAGDVGYVLLLPLSAALFHSAGRHPLAGLAAAFSGVSGGFAANLLLSPTDLILAGLTQEAARLIQPATSVTAMANYFFLGSSVLLVTAVGTVVTERVVVPRLGVYDGEVRPEPVALLTPAESRGLRWAGWTLAGVVVLILAGLVPSDGYLHDPASPGFLKSYFIRGLVFFIFVLGVVPGLAYGLGAGTLRSDADVYKGMQKNLELMAGYLVVVFFISQFIALFGTTNLGVILAVKGAALLKELGLGLIPLVLGVVLVTCSIDLVVGSASAKWALLAPVLVPLFMLLGYSPELAQVAYRVGDSITNIITPLSSNFPLVLMFLQRYAPKAGIGTLTAMMLPFSLANLAAWTAFLVLWILLGWPLGPGAPLHLP